MLESAGANLVPNRRVMAPLLPPIREFILARSMTLPIAIDPTTRVVEADSCSENDRMLVRDFFNAREDVLRILVLL